MRAPVSPLFVPGDRPERFAKAAASDADAIIIDLEDAVDPARKGEARRNLAGHGVTSKPVYVRINSAAAPWWEDDLAALAAIDIAGVVVPKAERADDIAAVARAAGGNAAIIPLVETVAGLDALGGILAAPQVLCVGFGALDFGLDLGCEPSWDALLYTRSQMVLASRRAGKAPPIDGVTPNLEDLELVGADARRARAMGFGGKLAIHPKQVGAILAAFQPSERERAWAGQVLAAATSDGVVKVNGEMVDRPLVERARRILGR